MASYMDFTNDEDDNIKRMFAGAKDDPDDSDDDNSQFKLKKDIKVSSKKYEDADDDMADEDDEEDVIGDDDDDDEDEEDDDEDEDADILQANIKVNKMNTNPTDNNGKNKFDSFISDDEADDDDDEENDDEDYLQKFNTKMKQNNIAENHPELIMHNNDEVDVLAKIVRDENGVIIDPLHRTLPFLSKYEKARILGEASRQIDCGRQPYIQLEEGIIDSYVIASKELEMKRLPFIIRRPLPNGSCEYWKLSDLEFINE